MNRRIMCSITILLQEMNLGRFLQLSGIHSALKLVTDHFYVIF